MGKGESGQLSPRYKHGQTGTLEYGRMSAAIRQTRKTAAGGRFTVVDIERIAIRQGFRCVYCKCSIKRKYHIDHIRPVSLGGSSDPSNLQLLCPPCNLRKYNLAPEKFAQKIGFLF